MFKTFDGLVLKESRMRTSKSVLILRQIDCANENVLCQFHADHRLQVLVRTEATHKPHLLELFSAKRYEPSA